MFKYTLPHWVQGLFPSLTWKVETTERKVYLTFDDGPHPEITPWVLGLLAHYKARATFFCIGNNIRKFPGIYQQILLEGHRTGNHTFDHLNGWKVSGTRYVENIRSCESLVKSNLFRPPFGKITPSQIRTLKGNYRIIMWSFLTRDYDKDTDPEKALIYLKKRIQPGAILVLHDSEKAEGALKKILPELLSFCTQKGYTFDSL